MLKQSYKSARLVVVLTLFLMLLLLLLVSTTETAQEIMLSEELKQRQLFDTFTSIREKDIDLRR